MSELVKICKFKGKDDELEFYYKYIVTIKEVEKNGKYKRFALYKF